MTEQTTGSFAPGAIFVMTGLDGAARLELSVELSTARHEASTAKLIRFELRPPLC